MIAVPRRTGYRALAALGLALLCAAAFVLVLRKTSPALFRRSQVFAFYMRTPGGVEKGTPVWVNGLDAGEVIAMELAQVNATVLGGNPEEGVIVAVKVICRVYSPFHRNLRQGSQVETLLLSVLGKPRVHVIPAAPNTPRAPDGDILAQRTTRGIEGVAEDLIDRSERINRRGEALSMHFDSLEGDADGIDARWTSGSTTLYALLHEGPEREALKAASEDFSAKASALGETLKGVQRDLEDLGDDLLGPARTDADIASGNFQRAWKRFTDDLPVWKGFIADFEAFTRATAAVVDEAKDFFLDYKVFDRVKNRALPSLILDYYAIEQLLLKLALRRIRVANLEDPREEQALHDIGRGRVKEGESR